jgi:LytS/YehU family sensor histidine kinase
MNREKKLENAKLQKEAFIRKLLIGGLFLLLLLGFTIVRIINLKSRNERLQLEHKISLQQAESERTSAGLQQQATELKMQALRAQMNPHFIFNSLNSINMFILENDKWQASEYLSRFSRLIRLMLLNSRQSFIPLENELEALELYLQLECLRFDKKFEYKITVDASVETGNLVVPPLIIQPYAENSIWHGLMNKTGNGMLDIYLFRENEKLFCRITDNGVGRKKAADLKTKSPTKHKSVGMNITEDRLVLMQKHKIDNLISVKDLVMADGIPCGTEVTIQMPGSYD